MPGESPRLRLELQLTEAEIRKLKARAEADGRPVGNYVARLLTRALDRPPKQFRPMPMRSTRSGFPVALPLRYLDREALDARAEEEMRSLSQYVTRVVIAARGR